MCHCKVTMADKELEERVMVVEIREMGDKEELEEGVMVAEICEMGVLRWRRNMSWCFECWRNNFASCRMSF